MKSFKKNTNAIVSEIKKSLAENKISQMKESALKEKKAVIKTKKVKLIAMSFVLFGLLMSSSRTTIIVYLTVLLAIYTFYVYNYSTASWV